jgi:hypothetical protein
MVSLVERPRSSISPALKSIVGTLSGVIPAARSRRVHSDKRIENHIWLTLGNLANNPGDFCAVGEHVFFSADLTVQSLNFVAHNRIGCTEYIEISIPPKKRFLSDKAKRPANHGQNLLIGGSTRIKNVRTDWQALTSGTCFDC